MKKIYKYNTRKELLDFTSVKLITFVNNIKYKDINVKYLDQEFCNELFYKNINHLSWIPYKYQTKEMKNEIISKIIHQDLYIYKYLIKYISPSLFDTNDCNLLIKFDINLFISLPYRLQDKLEKDIISSIDTYCYKLGSNRLSINDRYNEKKIEDYLNINGGYKFIRFYNRIR